MRIDRIKLITEMAKKEISVNAMAEKSGLTRATVSAVKGGKAARKKRRKSWLPVWAFLFPIFWRNEVIPWLIC